MPPESLPAFHQALCLGPDYCPEDLFDGTIPAIVRGLKAHANNIAYARHTALEETYPRLARHLGPNAFHDAVDRFLEATPVLGRSLNLLGHGFEEVLECPQQRDLARAEWAWFQAFEAEDADALSLTALAQMTPDELLSASLLLHPATRCLGLEAGDGFAWDHELSGSGDFLLISRPRAEVLMSRIDEHLATIIDQLAREGQASVTAADPAALIALVEAGAIQLGDRP